jgi:hypothetical protein
MRRWVAFPVVSVLLLAACGGDGGESGDGVEGGGADTTTAAGDFDPDAVVIYVAQGSSLSRIEPAGDNT